MIDCRVARRFTLNGTIDKHDPVGVTFRVTGGKRPFWLTVITVNWGRGYDAGKFKRNVMRVLNRVGDLEYVVLLIQELDEEPDPAHEKQVFRSVMEPGTMLVGWHTREPIAVSPGVQRVHRRDTTLTMGSGQEIGAPAGTGPDRFFVECCVVIEGVHVGCGNQHPHRDLNNPKVQEARRGGKAVTRERVHGLVRHCDIVVHGGDMNDANYPRSHPQEKVANERGLDTIRVIVA